MNGRTPYRNRIAAARALGGVLLSVLLIVPAIAQNNETAESATAEKEAADFFRPRINVGTETDSALRLARNLTESGAYAEAAERYADLLAKNPRTLDQWPVGSTYYLPLWRIVLNETCTWPADGLAAYRAALGGAARNEFREATASGDLARLEQLAQQYFLTEVGDDAAVMVADRCRENGWPALALYYYLLVLEKYPDSDLPRGNLLLRATLAAREAGLEGRYQALAAELAKVTAATDLADTTSHPAVWVAAQKAQKALSSDPTAGFGNQSVSPPVAAATVTWSFPLASRSNQQYGYVNGLTASSTSPVYPTLSGDTLYLANLTVAWAVDVRSGNVLWRFDTRPAGSEGLPGVGTAQARQPLVVDGVVYVPLEKPKKAGDQQQEFGLGTRVVTDLHALDAATGRPLWKWGPQDGGLDFAELSVEGQPVVAGDYVYVSLCSPSSYFGETHAAALDRRTGRLRWTQPVCDYPANFAGSGNGWSMVSDNAGTALAFRQGLLLSSGLGVTCALSGVNGSILWLQVMPDMPSPKTSSRQGVFQPQQATKLVNGMPLARRPRLLAERGLAVTGFAMSPTLWAYDWLDGNIVWQESAQGASQPLALVDDRVVAWGSTVLSFDLQTGKAQYAPPKLDEPISGEPIFTQGKVLLPTKKGIVTLDAASGAVESTALLPPDVAPGNLALGECGLVIVSDRNCVCMHTWERAKEQFLALAEADPEDPQPLVTLGAAALRLEKTEAGLEYLDGALARQPNDEQKKRIYQLFEDFYRLSYLKSSRELMSHVLDRLEESATSGLTRCRQAFLRAEFVGAENARAAMAALQQILDDPDSRHTVVSGSTGPGMSGILAEEAIDRMIAARGREFYRPWELQATAARQKARQARDYDALLEVAMRYPNSLSARPALDDALAIVLQRPDLNEADRLLIRLVNSALDGASRQRYRALLVDTSLKLGDTRFAQMVAEGLSRTSAGDARVRRLDGSETTVAEVLRHATEARNKAVAVEPAPPENQLPSPPYRLAWTLPNDNNRREFVQPVRRIRCADAVGETKLPLDDEVLWMQAAQKIVAINRADGKTRWEYSLKQDGPYRWNGGLASVGRTGLYVPNGNRLVRIDPSDGRETWSIHLQPAARRQSLAPQEALLGTLAYGDTSWQSGTRENAFQFDELGDKLIASTRFTLHVVDPRDGYTIRSIGYPSSSNANGIARFGGRVLLAPLSPPTQLQGHVFLYDLATGSLERDVKVGGAVFLADSTGGEVINGRYCPLVVQNKDGIALADMATGEVSAVLPITGLSPRGYYPGQTVLVTEDAVYAASQYTTLKAVDRQAGQTLWTYNSPANRQIQSIRMDPQQRLVLVAQNTMTGLQAKDGKVLWTQDFGKTGVTNVQFLQMVGDRLLVQVTRQTQQMWRQVTVLVDTSNGEVLFEFSRPNDQNCRMMMADRYGYLVMRGDTGETEYWVHDDAGVMSWSEPPVKEKPAVEKQPEADDEAGE